MSAPGGFGPAALAFFDGLEEDNSRSYWDVHRDVFDREVAAPMAALLESLPAAYQPWRTFRMYRDVRFSKDKSPLKTQHSALHEQQGVAHYVQVSAAGVLVATGAYQMERDQLERFRAAVDDNRLGRGLERLLDKLDQTGVATDGMAADALKTAPRGFARDHPRVELLRRKGVTAHRALTGHDLADGARLRDFVIETYEAAEPLNRWLRRHVGATTISRDR